MGRRKMPPYVCPRCGYTINKKSSMYSHLYNLKTICPALSHQIDLTEHIKEKILINRTYKPPIDVLPTSDIVGESFFQSVLEHHFGYGHKKLHVGVTDITTDKFHAEIKEWRKWKSAIGQLMMYNKDDPKDELRLYLFGKRSQKMKEKVCQYLTDMDVGLYECLIVSNGVKLVNLFDGSEELYEVIVVKQQWIDNCGLNC